MILEAHVHIHELIFIIHDHIKSVNIYTIPSAIFPYMFHPISIQSSVSFIWVDVYFLPECIFTHNKGSLETIHSTFLGRWRELWAWELVIFGRVNASLVAQSLEWLQPETIRRRLTKNSCRVIIFYWVLVYK